MRRRGAIVIALALACAGLAAPARAAEVEPSTLQLVGNFSSPVFVTSDPTNPDREFVVEKDGRIMASANGVTSTFLDLNDQEDPALDFVSACMERGLLSMAFPPDYGTSGYFYVLYNRSDTSPGPGGVGDVQIDEFQTVNGAVVMASQRHVLTIDHTSSQCQHNGGQMQFGPDGYLYISSGDGYDYGAPQDLDSLLGKVLRISPRPVGGAPYTNPATNPFVGVPGANEIWSYGVRNPWRFSFDRLTGAFILGDVGDHNWEELNYDPASNAGRAVNFGWSECEGLEIYDSSDPFTHGGPCVLTGDTPPAYTFPHTVDTGQTTARCAITGGYVARDQSLGALYGRYLFADLCSGQVYSAALAPAISDVRQEPITVETPSTFGQDACGRLYIAELGGAVYRIVGDTPNTCGADPGGTTGGGTTGGGSTGGGTTGGGDPGAGGGGGEGTDPGTGEQPGATCSGRFVTQAVPQTSGRLNGTSGADVILGSDGDDQIAGHGGGDLICSGDGDDTVKGGGGGDNLQGGPGADSLNGGGGTDHCKGGPGKDTVKSC
jgi:glucose/arabinose dehydrogenase